MQGYQDWRFKLHEFSNDVENLLLNYNILQIGCQKWQLERVIPKSPTNASRKHHTS